MNENKSFVTPKWLIIKKLYEENTNGNSEYGSNFEIRGELDLLSREFVDLIGELTHKFGYEAIVEGVHLNLWKERIWSLIQNAGLLEDIAWKEELYDEELERNEKEWYTNLDELDIEVNNDKQVKHFVKTVNLINDPDEFREEEVEVEED